jgi:hypothetical protein
MRSEREVFLNIKVTNKDTNAVFEHSGVPLDHVENLKLNPNLRVEVIGRARSGKRSDKNFNRR